MVLLLSTLIAFALFMVFFVLRTRAMKRKAEGKPKPQGHEDEPLDYFED